MKTTKLNDIEIIPISREEFGVLRGGFAQAPISLGAVDGTGDVKNEAEKCKNNCTCTIVVNNNCKPIPSN